MSKTIKQIADEIGVTKQAVTYRLKQLEETKENGVLATKKDGILLVSLAGENLIKQAFFENNRKVFGDNQPPNSHQNTADLLAVLQTTINALQAQLNVKDKQLEAKDQQINELISTNKAQAESINADRHNEFAETLIEGQQQLITDGTDITQKEKVKKQQGFWSRLFGKNETIIKKDVDSIDPEL